MVFFIGLVLALVIAWLICQFIRKTWKPFFTRFIPKLFKVTMWTTLVISALYIGFVIVDFTYHYTEDYIYQRYILAAKHQLPGDLIPQIREHGVKKVWRRWYWNREMSYEEQEVQAKEQEALVIKNASTYKHPIDYQFYASNPGFWKRVTYCLARKYIDYETFKERHF